MEHLVTSPTALALILFAGYFAGFFVGRRVGRREGFGEGVRFAPLEMRRRSWERGACVICGHAPERSRGAQHDHA